MLNSLPDNIHAVLKGESLYLLSLLEDSGKFYLQTSKVNFASDFLNEITEKYRFSLEPDPYSFNQKLGGRIDVFEREESGEEVEHWFICSS